MILEMIQVWNAKCVMKQNSARGLPSSTCLAYLDKHLTLDAVMVSVVSSIPTGANFFADSFLNLLM